MKETYSGGADRTTEWFVPSHGSRGLRVAVGLLFLPYTGMVLAYTVIGSMLAPRLAWDRVAAIVIIYFLALGIGAHALDALGSRRAKPWGVALSARRLKIAAASSLILAYAIGVYYMVLWAPLLWPIAILEGFFVFAYDLEWYGGRFHTDGWFAFSWGALPVAAGYILQTNRLVLGALVVAAAMAFLSLVEIKASRPYKELKRSGASPEAGDVPVVGILENVLRWISLGVIMLAAGLVACRLLA